MYYVLDLKAAAIAKHGQQHFDNHVPEGKELSGVAAKERAEKGEQERVAAQAASDRAPYAVVPPERLLNKGLDQLQAILIRCEGGKKLPHCPSKAGCVERILKAGYDMAAEAAAMARQKAADDERRAQQEAERAVLRAKLEKDAANAKAKAEAAAALKAERMKKFDEGSLSIDELQYGEIQEQLSRLGVPGKERVGKKEELRVRPLRVSNTCRTEAVRIALHLSCLAALLRTAALIDNGSA